MAYTVMACITMAYTTMAYIVMAYVVIQTLPHVRFDRVACRLDKPGHISFILLADSASNERLQQRAATVERAVEKAGVKLSFRRRQLEPFHITVATTTKMIGSFPFARALAKINNGTVWPVLDLALPVPVGT